MDLPLRFPGEQTIDELIELIMADAESDRRVACHLID